MISREHREERLEEQHKAAQLFNIILNVLCSFLETLRNLINILKEETFTIESNSETSKWFRLSEVPWYCVWAFHCDFKKQTCCGWSLLPPPPPARKATSCHIGTRPHTCVSRSRGRGRSSPYNPHPNSRTSPCRWTTVGLWRHKLCSSLRRSACRIQRKDIINWEALADTTITFC